MACTPPCELTCRFTCGKGHISKRLLARIEAAYKKLKKSDSPSLLKKHLKQQVFDLLKDMDTPMGSTFWDVIRSGIKNLDSRVGVYAPDRHAYLVYRELFDPIIEEYHGFGKDDKQPKHNWGKPSRLGKLYRTFVLSTRVRCVRTLDDYPFCSQLTKKQFLQLERHIKEILRGFEGEYAGKYQHISTMTREEQDQLIHDNILFKEGKPILEAANVYRHWPTGRGIYSNFDKNFFVWVCEEDHIKVISMQKGGDIDVIYERLMGAMRHLRRQLYFAKSLRLGYISFCPTNLGTTIKASAHMKLPMLSTDMTKFMAIANQFHMNVRVVEEPEEDQIIDIRGEFSPTFEVSNRRRLGITEYDAVKEFADGVRYLVDVDIVLYVTKYVMKPLYEEDSILRTIML